MAFKGIIEALNAGPVEDSPLYVFTDAPPKDATLDNIEEAKNRAQIAGINVYFFATRGCGDPSSVKPFENLARETCGQIFALPKSSSDIASMKKVAKDLLGGTTCSAKGVGSFFGKKRSASPSVHILLVDDTMEKIIVSVSSENSGADINLKDPLGSFVTSGKSVLSKVTIFDVKNPTPGIWQLVVSPKAGKYTYLFKGSSKTNVVFDFIFVTPRRTRTPRYKQERGWENSQQLCEYSKIISYLFAMNSSRDRPNQTVFQSTLSLEFPGPSFPIA